jgi:hypothetical protein
MRATGAAAYQLFSGKAGAGVARDISISASTGGAGATQLQIQVGGNIGAGTAFPIAAVHAVPKSAVTVCQILQGFAAQTADMQQIKDNGGSIYSGIDNIGNRYNYDSVYNYFGTGKDMSIDYNGTVGRIQTDLVAPSDLLIDCGTNKTIELQETVYNDLVLPLDSARVPAANAPSWESFVGNLNAYAYEVNDYQEFTSEILHGYNSGSDLEFHIHGALNAALAGGDETVKFEIEYSIADMDSSDGLGDVFPAPTTINAEFTVPNGTADLTNIYISIGVDSTASWYGTRRRHLRNTSRHSL